MTMTGDINKFLVSASTLATRLGVALPVIQAPMAGAQGVALAIGVSNAGGLGSLPGAMLTPDGLRDEITAITTSTLHALQRKFFLPHAADGRRRSRGAMA